MKLIRAYKKRKMFSCFIDYIYIERNSSNLCATKWNVMLYWFIAVCDICTKVKLSPIYNELYN